MDQQSAFSEEKKRDLRRPGKKLGVKLGIFGSKAIFEIQEVLRRNTDLQQSGFSLILFIRSEDLDPSPKLCRTDLE